MSRFDHCCAPRWVALSRALFAGLLCLALSTATRWASAAPLDEFASAWAEQYDVSGAWRLQRGDVVLAEGGRGTSDGVPTFNGDTPFYIGSNSKQFAAVAVLRLVEQGRVELTAPLTRYFPELKPEAVTRGSSTCSVEHVLSHRCGLIRSGVLRGAAHLWDAGAEAELLAIVNGAELQFEPGQGFSYSNLGYGLIGLLVKRASGQDYEAFLREQFWAPLGMSHTGIRPPEGLPMARGQVGAVFTWVDARRWLSLDLDTTLGAAGAAGNIFSSARDLAIWVTALHHDRVLLPASRAELIRPRAKDYALGLVHTAAPMGKLIWHDVIWHNGSLSPDGFSSWAGYVPEHDLAVVVLANRPIEAGRPSELANALLREASGQPASPPTESAFALRLQSSWFLLLMRLPVLMGVLGGLMMLRRMRRPELFDRQNWWLSYHVYALLLAMPIPPSASLWLAAWGLVVLAVLYRSRFWQLPSWQRGPSRRPRLALGLRALLLLVLAGASLTSAEDVPSFLAFAGLMVAEACLWFFVVQQRSTGSSAEPSVG
jgi:CubicO group peptidase (beta-lactamase class C family)